MYCACLRAYVCVCACRCVCVCVHSLLLLRISLDLPNGVRCGVSVSVIVFQPYELSICIPGPSISPASINLAFSALRTKTAVEGDRYAATSIRHYPVTTERSGSGEHGQRWTARSRPLTLTAQSRPLKALLMHCGSGSFSREVCRYSGWGCWAPIRNEMVKGDLLLLGDPREEKGLPENKAA